MKKAMLRYFMDSPFPTAIRLPAVLILAILCILHPGQVFSAITLTSEEQRYLESLEKIVFVSQTDYPPFEFVDVDESSNGMMVELAQWLSTVVGVEAVFVDANFLEAQKAVQDGTADVITSFFYSPSRDQTFDFTQTIFEVPASIFVRPDRLDIVRAQDLAGKRVAMQRGDFAGDFLSDLGIAFEKIPTGSFSEAAQAVISGVADAVIGDEQILMYYLHRYHLTDQLKISGEPLYVGQNAMAVKAGNVHLQSILDQGISYARQSGKLQEIEDKWLGKTLEPRPFEWKALWPYAFVMLVIVSTVLFWNLHLRRVLQRKSEELRKNEQRLEYVIEGAHAGTWEWNIHTGVVSCNERWAEIIGSTVDELAPMTMDVWRGLIHPDDLAASEASLRRHLSGKGQHFQSEVRLRHRNGGWVWVFSRGKVHDWFDDGTPRLMAGTSQDVTERVEAQQVAQESLSRLQKLTENVPGLVCQFVRYPNGRYAFPYASKEMFSLYGTYPEEVRHSADKVLAAVHPCDYERVVASIESSAADLTLWKQVFRVNHPAGHQLWIEGIASPEQCPDGAVMWYGYTQDITARVQQDLALKESEERYRLTMNAASTGIWDWDITNDNIAWDDQCYRMLGYEPNQFQLNLATWKALLHPDDRRQADQMIQDLLEGENTLAIEFRYRLASGDWLWVQGRGKVVAWTDDGQPDRVLGTHADIHERKQAELALATSEQRFRQFAENTDTVFWVRTREQFLYISPAYEQLWGCSCQSLYTDPDSFFDMIHPDDQQRIRSSFLGSLHNNQTFDEQCRLAAPDDEGERWVQVRSFLIHSDDVSSESWAGVAIDITLQKRYANTLEVFNSRLMQQVEDEVSRRMLSEQNYRILVEKSPEGVSIVDFSGRFVSCNPAAEKILGMPEKYIVGKTIHEFSPPYQPDGRSSEKLAQEIIQQALNGQRTPFEWVHLNAHGEEVVIEVLLPPLDDLKSEQFLALSRDITSVKKLQKERRLQEMAMVQQSKMAEIGTMMGAIVHQWKQPLNNISLQVTSLMADHEDGLLEKGDLQKFEQDIYALVTFMSRTIDDFRNFFIPAAKETVFCAPKSVRTVLSIIKGQFVRDMVQVTVGECDDLYVRGREGEFQQVILNILNNAREALLEARKKDRWISVEFEATNGDICICITDNGTGIPEHLLPNAVFELFTSTKGDCGTGIGMSLTRQIITKMNGTITAANTGSGAKFTICLPLVDPE
ncbi:PAS domain-containing protein [Desulfurispira natronophila]|uniref:histidine kinase n=1 Tax=Desulfurispira natronophila TaxID=682562 RepID=A0A7W8DHM2_9BACT|nr:PAS domain-containing protein [Desulfurispira natronophila]MBB5022517.1 PAS domain S-box-containing protein [Desulfurispira natronophila]